MKSVALVFFCIAALALGGCSPASEVENDFDALMPMDQLTLVIERLGVTLGGITDVASAQSALPALQTAKQQISSVTSRYRDQSSDTQQMMNLQASEALPGLQSQVTELKAMPGVSEILDSTLDSIMSEFDFLT